MILVFQPMDCIGKNIQYSDNRHIGFETHQKMAIMIYNRVTDS
jgi:hypothetical protein